MPVRGSLRTGQNRNESPCNNMWEMERRYSVPAQEHSVMGSDIRLQRRSQTSQPQSGTLLSASGLHSTVTPSASEDLHAWSIYRLVNIVLKSSHLFYVNGSKFQEVFSNYLVDIPPLNCSGGSNFF